MSKITDKLREPLTNFDIMKYLPDARIYKYNELDEFKNVEQLLPKKIDYIILLTELHDYNNGHWQAIYRKNHTIYFLDSYGYRVDKLLEFLPHQLRKDFDQNIPHLSYLMNKAVDDGFKVYMNGICYQNKDSFTCGYHCVNFVKFMKMNNNGNFIKYYKFMKQWKSKLEMSYDLVVIYLTVNQM